MNNTWRMGSLSPSSEDLELQIAAFAPLGSSRMSRSDFDETDDDLTFGVVVEQDEESTQLEDATEEEDDDKAICYLALYMVVFLCTLAATLALALFGKGASFMCTNSTHIFANNNCH
eukprot:snap_masked-scaffold_4-processed-gene-8.7-mRNA-1 protein AED:1.00 eAED:1.00 QI:0/-1/0/0/-1/1/1/0/116